MTFTALARRTVVKWQNWRQRRTLRRALPWLPELDNQETRYRKAHSKGCAATQQRKRNLMTACLRLKVERDRNA